MINSFKGTFGLKEELKASSARVAFRTGTPDKLPLVGEVPAVVSTGDTSGLYISLAHGSRGLLSCTTSGEILAAKILNDPMPLPMNIIKALDPKRYISRYK